MGKIELTAKYIGLSLLARNMTVSHLKLQKLLYYVQAWHMVYFNQDPLFDRAPEAWVNGPVYTDVYKIYKDKTANMCDHLTLSDFINDDIDVNKAWQSAAEDLRLTRDELELIDSVVMLYGSKTQNELIYLTHAERPWIEARGNLEPFERSTNKISLDTMYRYYKERHDRNRRGA